MPQMFGGMRVQTSAYLTKDRPEQRTVRRTWWERLFSGYCPGCQGHGPSFPWCPWQATRTFTVVVQVPSPDVLMMSSPTGPVLLMHPATLNQLLQDKALLEHLHGPAR